MRTAAGLACRLARALAAHSPAAQSSRAADSRARLGLPPLCLRHRLPDRQARGCPIRCPGIVEPVEPPQALWIDVFLWIRIDLLVRRDRLSAQRAVFTTNSGADLRLEGSPRRRARKQAAAV